MIPALVGLLSLVGAAAAWTLLRVPVELRASQNASTGAEYVPMVEWAGFA